MSEQETSNNEGGQVDTQKQEQLAAVEKEARLLGWVPKEDFRDGDHWVDAETFVKRGKEINPILRKNNEILLKKLDAANAEVAEVKKVAKEFEKFQKELADRKVKELEAELKELKEQKKEAISKADGDAVVAIDEAIDAIKEQQQQAKQAPVQEEKKTAAQVTLDPVITTWMADNEWFTTDQKYTRMADAIGATLSEERPDLVGKAFFDELDKQLEEILPEKYKKTKTRRSPVEGGQSSTTRPAQAKKQTYDNLPADAKAACDKFVKQGFMTKEQYVAEYEWD